MGTRSTSRRRTARPSLAVSVCAAVAGALWFVIAANGGAEPAVSDRLHAGTSAGVRVRVRALSTLAVRAELRASADPAADEACGHVLRIWGTLHDDVGAPLPLASLSVSLATAKGAQLSPLAPLRVGASASEPASRTHACSDHARDAALDGASHRIRIETDGTGRFCLRACAPPEDLRATLAFEGGEYQAPTTSTLRVDPIHGASHLEFAPEIHDINLDEDDLAIKVIARGLLPDELSRASLALTAGAQAVLATLPFSSEGVAEGRIPTRRLGGVGPGSLVAKVIGDNLPPVPEAVTSISRTARVDLEIERVRSEWFGTAAEILVKAHWKHGVVDAGAIEAHREGHLVTAAPVRADGTARLLLEPVGHHASPMPVLLRYTSNGPFFVSGASMPVTLPAPRSFRWPTAMLIALGFGVGFVALRSRSPRRLPAPLHASTPVPSPSFGADAIWVVHPSDAPGTWTGRVLDAHDRVPIGRASIEVILPSFPSSRAAQTSTPPARAASTVLAATQSDDDGTFCFHVQARHHDVHLRIRAPWHASVDCHLPPAGDLIIAMRSRRRALLDRLVGWARRNLPPESVAAEPTPRDVLSTRHARRRDEATPAGGPDAVAVWAAAVQDAAFGPKPVDEGLEAQVSELEPRLPS